MSARKQRSAMAAAVMLLVFVVGLFAFALARSHAEDRRDAETRFVERARISAALTESLFASTADEAAAQNNRRFGGETVDQARLERQRSESAPRLCGRARRDRAASSPPRASCRPTCAPG